ncbi:MAG TPA: DEAD/DEAH box helicase, partial [Gammaproteobacteria bacterium]|nr:DEAD/DEAH box helicase [Gammaproteobacteria bacterium]
MQFGILACRFFITAIPLFMLDFTTHISSAIPSSNQPSIQWSGLSGAATGLAISQLGRQQSAPLLVVCRSSRQAQRLEEEVSFFQRAENSDSSSRARLFPDWECLPYDVFSPHPDIISRRLGLLHTLDLKPQSIILTSVANLMQRLPPASYLRGHAFSLQIKQRLDVQRLRGQLQQASYAAVSQVLACGEYAIRGGLFDIFPIGSTQPFRLDLFDDEIESIHYFDPQTQRSGEQTEQIRMLPAREFPMTEEAIRHFRQQFRKTFSGDPNANEIYRGVSKGQPPIGVDYLFPLFFDTTATLFDYLPKSTILLLDDDVADAASHFQAETNDRYLTVKGDLERPTLPPHELYLSTNDLQDRCQYFRQIRLTRGQATPGKSTVYHFPCSPPPQLPVNHKAPKPYQELTSFIKQFDGRIALVAETAGRREALLGILGLAEFRAKEVASFNAFIEDNDCRLGMLVGRLDQGLLLAGAPAITLITESQLYGDQVLQRRRRTTSHTDPNAVIRSLAELNIKDPVVHVDHGVGRYQGLQHLDIGGNLQEFLVIIYRDEDKLYVPILSLQQVTRYIGGDSETAPLHKLGSEVWSKAKKRADQRARDVAAELLATEALRKSRQGQSCAFDEASYLGFCSGFAFEETPDQAVAIGAVIKDLIAPKAMDRLVCGDVGFGKTEVALRAAFVVVESGRQVAILVPTTLLAQQHYQNFTDRFADQAISIELLSRFRSRSEVATVLKRLQAGSLDIVIGTHRLLQSDIAFKNLGLLILDEEQRFGVRQKEKLKKLRAEVDILTLTATPIPRTLHMAMSGLREISIISTPPRNRLSIKTFVHEWSNQLIREACQRELRRGGQIYFLHNEVSTINAMAERLHEILPECEIAIAHGQMPERRLEHVMREFYHRRFHILLCSTIIENGIDIPNANTMII